MLLDYLSNHIKGDKVSFHMPGHKGSAIYKKYGFGEFIDTMMDCDITEIDGADNLHQPEGILDEVQKMYAEIYGVKNSYLLVNGSTVGVLVGMMSAVRPGKKILMSRGCHKSAYTALKLGDIKPVYLQPQEYNNEGIIGKVAPQDVRDALEKDPDIDAVILPSPNYYGICSDIEAIAKAVHEKGKILIVDQAHGAHLKFFHSCGAGEGMPLSAEESGADIVINSIHKTLASFTQSALLNVASDRVDLQNVRENLNMLQSTSPSYILMSSLAINALIIKEHGKEAFSQWRENIEYFYKEAANIQGLRVITGDDMDRTKLNVDLSEYGINGRQLDAYLQSKGIQVELVTGNIAMGMSGIGNVRRDYDRFLEALKSAIYDIGSDKPVQREVNGFAIPAPGPVKDHSYEKEEINIKEAVGRISATTVIPYPPGIPFICPGEEFTEEIVNMLIKLKNEEKMIAGMSDRGTIHVYKK